MRAKNVHVPFENKLRRARRLATVTPPIALIAAAFIAGSIGMAVPADDFAPVATPVSVDSAQPTLQLEPALQRLDSNDDHG